MKIALITGASSGLGREFVLRIDKEQRVDEIWVIARRADRLEQLRDQTTTPIRPLPMDLTDPASLEGLSRLLNEEKPLIDILVCAAGFGRIGRSRDIPSGDNLAMIDLNCRAAVAVTSMAFPFLEKGSRIIEICSTAGFQPMPSLGVYAASKAFLLSYTKNLHHELLLSGIHVTAVCPYWVKDTEFIPTAQTADVKSYHHFLLANRSKTVVWLAMMDSRLNLWVSTPGPVCLIHHFFAKFIPHFIMVPLMDLLRFIL